ncbi:MAG: hypothetical protein GC156_09875 [Actinomycetales bacterium]|nr:hypothetical protein [Actinomycetales bacterium]
MMRNEYETTSSGTDRKGVLLFATHTPTTGYPYGDTRTTAHPEQHGWRIAILGGTALAVIAGVFGVTAYLRAQDTTSVRATQTASVMVPASVYAQQVPFAARVEVPHAAAGLLAADTDAALSAARAQVPQSVYDEQVPSVR